MIKKLVLPLVTVSFLAACAQPVVVPPVGAEDRSKTCAELDRDIAQTKEYRDAARKDDEFQWKYILVVNAVASMYNINKAEKAAQDRLAELQELYAKNNCAMQGAVPVTPVEKQPMGLAPQ